MGCKSACFEYDFTNCNDIDIPVADAGTAPLQAGDTVYATLQKPGSGVVYKRTYTVLDAAPAAGLKITLLLADYPAGLFVPGRYYNIRVFKPANNPADVLPVNFPLAEPKPVCLLARAVALDENQNPENNGPR